MHPHPPQAGCHPMGVGPCGGGCGQPTRHQAHAPRGVSPMHPCTGPRACGGQGTCPHEADLPEACLLRPVIPWAAGSPAPSPRFPVRSKVRARWGIEPLEPTACVAGLPPGLPAPFTRTTIQLREFEAPDEEIWPGLKARTTGFCRFENVIRRPGLPASAASRFSPTAV